MPEAKGEKNDIISDSEKLGQIADMIRDAAMKFDSLSSRMDSIEEKFGDKGRKDAEESGEIKEPGEPREPAADKGRKDGDDGMMDRKDRKDAEEAEEAEMADKARRDAEEREMADKARRDAEEGDRRVADAVADAIGATQAEMAAMRRQIASLSARAPAMLNDIDRERFAVIQEQADPAFQAFGDRAPAPLDGETPTQYKRRIGAKLQANSPKWKDSRLSAVSDDIMLDTILADVYADSIAAARLGADVKPGHLREVSRQVGGHIINEFVGEPSSWMDGFVGQVKRASSRA